MTTLVSASLWNRDHEKDFFTKSLQLATPEQLFYATKEGQYYAYWPKSCKGTKTTLQSRNTLIGSYTEKWVSDLFNPIAETFGGYPVQDIIS